MVESTVAVGDERAAALLASAAAAHREAARAQHAEVVAVSAFVALRRELDEADEVVPEATASRVRFTPGEFALSEVSLALGISTVAAARLADTGDALEARPVLSAAFAAGEVDLARIRTVLDVTNGVHPDLLGFLDTAATDLARAHHGSRLAARLTRLVIRTDPDAATRRRVAAECDRQVQLRPRPDGTTTLWGRLRALDGVMLDQRLDAIADGPCADDPRTRDQLRADALTALALGTELGCRCGQHQQTTADPMPRVEVVVTGTGSAELSGHGPLDPALAAVLAAAADTVRAATPQATVTTVDPAAYRYTPSAGLARAVRLRDRTCRFPHCTRRATRADLDHTVPFHHHDPTSGGLTTADNLAVLCRHHHRAKTLRIFTYHHTSDAILEWTTPTGATHTTRPPPADDDPPPF